jgi:hypothetical protein
MGMRNDARPIGEASPHSAYEEVPARSGAKDGRDSVTRDRGSHVVDKWAEEAEQRRNADADPVMPTGDSTLNTKI